MGDVVTIKTLDGESEVQIPAGASARKYCKIKGAGIPVITKPSQRGDHIVIVKIKIPTKLNEEENAYIKDYMN